MYSYEIGGSCPFKIRPKLLKSLTEEQLEITP